MNLRRENMCCSKVLPTSRPPSAVALLRRRGRQSQASSAGKMPAARCGSWRASTSKIGCASEPLTISSVERDSVEPPHFCARRARGKSEGSRESRPTFRCCSFFLETLQPRFLRAWRVWARRCPVRSTICESRRSTRGADLDRRHRRDHRCRLNKGQSPHRKQVDNAAVHHS